MIFLADIMHGLSSRGGGKEGGIELKYTSPMLFVDGGEGREATVAACTRRWYFELFKANPARYI
jgi:hypothetical protein